MIDRSFHKKAPIQANHSRCFLHFRFVQWEKQAFVSWQLPEAHASPSLRRRFWPPSWRNSVSPIANTQ